MSQVNLINRTVSTLPYIKISEEFKKNRGTIIGKIRAVDIKGLNSDLEFDVQIHPEYPLRSYNSEAIKFINKELMPYNHVMGNGEICIHTPHSPNIREKLLLDFDSLKSWIEKYYIKKDEDSHYEHIIINEKPFNDIYYSFQFTNIEYPFEKGEFGFVNLIALSQGIYRDTPIFNYIVKSFHSDKEKICKWSDYYLSQKAETIGLFIYLKEAPANNKRFAYSNWREFENSLPDNFLNYIYNFKKKKRKHKLALLPIFFGYETVGSEIHWISAILNINDNFIKSEPILDSNGTKIKGQWRGVLIDKNIDWTITRNSSYKYFFGRGAFCDKITNAKVLIIGLGAIGSIVAKTLVKCGAKDLTIVDYDVKEPENACRSDYTFSKGLNDKTFELTNILYENSPFVNVKGYNNYRYFESYIKAAHKKKDEKHKFEESLSEFDIIFDCTTDNDLMYVLDQLNLKTDLINLSITNHAKDLVCAFYPNIYKYVQNQFINILDNDVNDLYNPTGCWSPTFRASYNDINLLVQYAMKEINKKYKENKPKDNFTLSLDSENNTNIKFTQY